MQEKKKRDRPRFHIPTGSTAASGEQTGLSALFLTANGTAG
jgi:hypothetical protein